MDRRNFLKSSALIALASSNSVADAKQVLLPTPSETAGPFYPIKAQKDTDFDLTQIQGQAGRAIGKAIYIAGQVMDTSGALIEDVTVELWQANAAGRYRHPSDSNPAPVDENFQGWAIVPTNQAGRFQFKTILPGAYAVSRQWIRPPHIHFKLSKKGFNTLTTQMYFPDEPLNDTDRLFMRQSPQDQQRLIAQIDESRQDSFNFKMVMQRS